MRRILVAGLLGALVLGTQGTVQASGGSFTQIVTWTVPTVRDIAGGVQPPLQVFGTPTVGENYNVGDALTASGTWAITQNDPLTPCTLTVTAFGLFGLEQIDVNSEIPVAQTIQFGIPGTVVYEGPVPLTQENNTGTLFSAISGVLDNDLTVDYDLLPDIRNPGIRNVNILWELSN